MYTLSPDLNGPSLPSTIDETQSVTEEEKVTEPVYKCCLY